MSAATVATLVTFFALRLFGIAVPADVALALATVAIGAVMYLVSPSEADLPIRVRPRASKHVE